MDCLDVLREKMARTGAGVETRHDQWGRHPFDTYTGDAHRAMWNEAMRRALAVVMEATGLSREDLEALMAKRAEVVRYDAIAAEYGGPALADVLRAALRAGAKPKYEDKP